MIARTPEFRIALFGFLAAFVWEMWQMPFCDQSGMAFMDMVQGCSLGSIGDAGIMVVAYRTAAWATGSRLWLVDVPRLAVFFYLATGLAITIVIEHLAINLEFGWRYSSLMAIDPLSGTGLVPVAMWIAIPLVTLWLARLQGPAVPKT